MLVLAACALAIPRSRDLHASTTRLEADLDAIETLIAERRACGSHEECVALCQGGGNPDGWKPVANVKPKEKYEHNGEQVEVDDMGFAMSFVSPETRAAS